MPDRGDGACLYLDENNLCTIYETRPALCNVRTMFDVHKQNEPTLTLKEHYIRNNLICNKWIKEDDMDSSYLINIEQYDLFDPPIESKKDGQEEISESRRGSERRRQEILQESGKCESEASCIERTSGEIPEESKEAKKLLCQDGRGEEKADKLKNSQ